MVSTMIDIYKFSVVLLKENIFSHILTNFCSFLDKQIITGLNIRAVRMTNL